MDPISPKLVLVKLPEFETASDPVAAEIRCIEGRVIEDVKELSPELHGEAFVDRDGLERREVELSYSRCHRRSLTAAQNRHISFATGGWSSSQRARLLEGQRIANPIQLSIGVLCSPSFWLCPGTFTS